MTKRRELSIEEIKELRNTCLDMYEYKDNYLYWKNCGTKSFNGKRVGCINSGDGYHQLSIWNKRWRTHRIIYLMLTGEYPEVVDHIDGNLDNNSIENLRAANFFQNCCNAKIQKNNTSGFKGVSFVQASNKWLARLRANRKIVFNQMYETKEEAVAAINIVRTLNHGDFVNHGN